VLIILKQLLLELGKVIIGVTSIMFLEGIDWDRNRRASKWCGRFFAGAVKSGKLPRNTCAAWRHGACR